MNYFMLILLLIGCTSLARKNYPSSDHFDGKKFYNLGEVRDKSFSDLIKWQWSRQAKLWPEQIDKVLPQQGMKPVSRLDTNQASYTFINHATVLLQVDGLNIITDPMFSERASPVSFAGPKRHRPPGISLQNLPQVDLILLSHNHYDHMDQETLRFLAQRDQPQVITGLGNAELLQDWGFKQVVELDWYQVFNFKNHEVHFVPAQHFSARGVFDRNQTLWGGFVFKASRGYIYFAGDTGFGEFIYEIAKKFQPIVFSLLPIGAYEPRWFMKDMHVNPSEALQFHQILNSKYSLGIHWGTFQLTDEFWNQPVLDLEAEIKKMKNSLQWPFVVTPEGHVQKLW